MFSFIVVTIFVLWSRILKKEILRRKKAEESLRELASTDKLTGLANRRVFDDVIEIELRRAKRTQDNLTLVLIDIDYFKNYNDQYGHQEGDKCLAKVATVLSGYAQRPNDLAARYGGEEFAMILGHFSIESALNYAELIRQSIEDLSLPNINTPIRYVTASLGVCVVEPDIDFEVEELIRLADIALYRAKERGRNQIELSSYSSQAV